MAISSLASLFTQTLLAPLERVKTILQTNHWARVRIPAEINNPLGVYVTIWNEQGIGNFLRGNMSNIYKFSTQAVVRAYIFERFALSKNNNSEGVNFIKNIGVNTVVSFILLTVAYPFDLVHTRMTSDMTKQGKKRLYSTVPDCFKKAGNSNNFISSIKSDTSGISLAKYSDLYKGYGFACAYTLPYAALSLPLFELFNRVTLVGTQQLDKENFYVRFLNRFVPPTLVLCLLSSALYPLETGKKLMQVNNSIGNREVFKSSWEIFKKLGMKELYKGYTVHLIKVIPFSFVQYSFYLLSKTMITQ